MAGRAKVELTERGIRMTRTFDAPPHVVFNAWTDQQHLDQWWGPNGFTNETHAMNFKPGGEWRYTMHGPDGVDYPNRILYQQIDAPHRLAYIHDTGEDDDPQAMEVTVQFEEDEGRTRLTMHTLFQSAEQRDHVVEHYNAIEGGRQTLDRLAEFLARH